MNDYIDISLTISPTLPRWPGSPQVSFTQHMNISSGDVATDTSVFFNIHTGTHIDAPAHFVAEGNTIDELPIDLFIGPAVVVEISETIKEINSDILDDLELEKDTKRILFRTRNSNYWANGDLDFHSDFVALTADGAHWLVERGFCLVGIDYLSIQRYEDGPETHQILLSSSVAVVEGLNLSSVVPGKYELICLPIKFLGLEGAPTRAVLRGPIK